MGSTFSKLQMKSYKVEARGIGNPESPLHSATTPATTHDGIVCFGHTLSYHGEVAETGETIFGYSMDPTKFDTGYFIIVKYAMNDRDRDYLSCLENRILRANSGMQESDFNQMLLPSILPLTTYTTMVTFSTYNGQPFFNVEKTYSLRDQPLTPMPENLAPGIPRIDIHDLVKPESFQTHSDPCVSIVTYKRKLYTYKHHQLSCPVWWRHTSYEDGLLREAQALSSITSPLVLPLLYIVTDNYQRGAFRGYMQPYLPAGSLEWILSSLSRVAHPLNEELEESAHNVRRYSRTVFKPLRIYWPVKHMWCIQMAQGLIDLHTSGAYSGSLTLKNFLIDIKGHIKIVDIAPVYGFSSKYVAPEVANCEEGIDLNLTAERDIFNLGLVFWMLAEEITEFARNSIMEIPVISWKERSSSAPTWFRELVTKCIQITPDARPSATEILSQLKSRFSVAGYH